MAGIFLPGTSKGGDISGVTAGVGLSGGGDSGGVTLTLDLSELSTVTPINGDFFATLDSDGATEQKTSTTALATLFAGDGLTASSAVLAVNVDDSTIETDSDAIRIKDNGVSLAKMAGLTRGSIIYGDTSGDPAALAKGSADYVLTSDGTDIAWAAAASGTSLSGSTDNTVATVTGANALAGEANLTFDGSTLAVTGAVTVSTDLTVSGGDIVYGNGQNATASVAATAHDAAGRTLTITAGPTTAGTSNNQAGGALTFQGGQGKGSGAGGSIVFQTANAAGSGSSLNALATALTIEDDLNATFGNDVLLNTDSAVLKMGVDADATLTHDGTTGLTVAANPFEVDSGGNITLDAHTGIFIFQDANTEVLRITEGNSGDVTIKLETNAKDLIFTDNGDAVGLTVKDGAVGIVVPGEVMTTKISFTDGDDAMTVADGGGVTFAQDVTTTSHKYINLPENSSIKFTDQIGTDNSADNDDGFGIIFTFKTGATVTPFSPVYLAADNLVEEADADAIATMPCIGISMNASDVTVNNDIEVMLLGLIRHDSFADFATAGAPVYVNGGASGLLATVAPSDANDVVQIVGHSIAEDTIFVQPSLSYVVVG
jgi:phage baseplate assembly protein gpV